MPRGGHSHICCSHGHGHHQNFWPTIWTFAPQNLMLDPLIKASTTVVHYTAITESTAWPKQLVFVDTGVKVTSEGRLYLGGHSWHWSHALVASKVQQWWKEELENLATIAHSQPQAAHAAFTHRTMNKWTYLTCTISDIGQLLEPLEVIIRTKLAPHP